MAPATPQRPLTWATRSFQPLLAVVTTGGVGAVDIAGKTSWD